MNTMTISEQSTRIQPAVLAIVATIEIAPERRDQFLPLLMAHRARSLKNEPGTLRFDIMAPHDDDTKLFLCAVYRDAAAFDVYRNGDSITQFWQEITGLGAKISLTRCTVME
jgi:(4S)-4-hydroxy-5-phosphonooxypentane-2,3-dione isomerase